MSRSEADLKDMELSGTNLSVASVKSSHCRSEWHAPRGKRRGHRGGKRLGALPAHAVPVFAPLH